MRVGSILGFSLLCGVLFPGTFIRPAFCQQTGTPTGTPTGTEADEENSKRIFWIIPNFRTSATLAEYKPITTKAKYNIATQDAFDRGTVALAVLFGGEAQLSNSNPSFGQGVKGYSHYLGASYADFVIGDYMTEGVFPSLLHQDPRYFRKGKGSFITRLGYSAGQIFFTHGDNGRTQLNYSELAGNSAAVAISMSYYPENRDVADGISKLGTQLAVDMASNILKEFAPDISHRFHRHREQ